MTAKRPKSKYYDIIDGPVLEKCLRKKKLFAPTDLQIKAFGRHTGQNIHCTAKTTESNLIKNSSSGNSSNIQFLKLKLAVSIRLATLLSGWHSSRISLWWGSCFLERWKNTDTGNSEIMWLQGNVFPIFFEAWRFIHFKHQCNSLRVCFQWVLKACRPLTLKTSCSKELHKKIFPEYHYPPSHLNDCLCTWSVQEKNQITAYLRFQQNR